MRKAAVRGITKKEPFLLETFLGGYGFLKNRVPFKRLVLDKMKTILDIGSGVYIMASQENPPL